MNNTSNGIPLVSVSMLAYNHEKYIAQSIESVLSQNVSFPFELVIADDCSSDKTGKIIESYQLSHPGVIRAQLNPENKGIPRNLYDNLCRCRGKYTTFISGDDYWIDDTRLQKQVDFLEAHGDYIGVETLIEERYTDSDAVGQKHPSERLWSKDLTLDDYLQYCDFQPSGLMFRNVFLTPQGKDQMALIPRVSKYIDDMTFCIQLLNMGKVHVLPQCTVAYRVRMHNPHESNYNSLNTPIQSTFKFIDLLNGVNRHYCGRLDLSCLYVNVLMPGVRYALKRRSLSELMSINRVLPKEYQRRGVFRRSVRTVFCTALKHRIRVREN